MTDHPITPPAILPIFDLCLSLELILTWKARYKEAGYTPEEVLKYVAWEAAQWGADQQPANDAEWLDQHALDAPHLKITPVGESLKEAMRPKPPSLKELALLQLDTLNADLAMHGRGCDLSQIRRAIEALPND